MIKLCDPNVFRLPVSPKQILSQMNLWVALGEKVQAFFILVKQQISMNFHTGEKLWFENPSPSHQIHRKCLGQVQVVT